MSCILLKMEDFLIMKPEGYQKYYTTTSEIYKSLSCRRGTASRFIPLEILSTAAKLYEKIALEKACKIGE